jgi:transcriptional regulator with XRE-family HTH domain
MAGISNPYLSQIERGLREPSERVVESIAKSLEMTADALYERAGVTTEESAPSGDVREAIEADEALTPRQRRALLEIHATFVAANGARVPRRRTSRE